MSCLSTVVDYNVHFPLREWLAKTFVYMPAYPTIRNHLLYFKLYITREWGAEGGGGRWAFLNEMHNGWLMLALAIPPFVEGTPGVPQCPLSCAWRFESISLLWLTIEFWINTLMSTYPERQTAESRRSLLNEWFTVYKAGVIGIFIHSSKSITCILNHDPRTECPIKISTLQFLRNSKMF